MNIQSKIKKLQREIDKLLVIHYSCESLSDDNKGYSPRITSIAVQHLESKTTHSFSFHIIAEEEKIGIKDIEKKYDFLEEKMLEKFYTFVNSHTNDNWLHWNMKNVSYGFEALEHRYKVLSGKDAPTIPDTKRFNLSSLIKEMYGENYVDSPKMKNLMELNNEDDQRFSSGIEEIKAFKNKKYFELHQSTLSKVNWFGKLFIKLTNRKIKIQHYNLLDKVNNYIESPLGKIVGFVSVLITLLTAFGTVKNQYFDRNSQTHSTLQIAYKQDLATNNNK
ncbi:MAG: hypothetical protein AAF298_18500 [Cyanobacteria bacterium P01_A01_bin.40]